MIRLVNTASLVFLQDHAKNKDAIFLNKVAICPDQDFIATKKGLKARRTIYSALRKKQIFSAPQIANHRPYVRGTASKRCTPVIFRKRQILNSSKKSKSLSFRKSQVTIFLKKPNPQRSTKSQITIFQQSKSSAQREGKRRSLPKIRLSFQHAVNAFDVFERFLVVCATRDEVFVFFPFFRDRVGAARED